MIIKQIMEDMEVTQSELSKWLGVNQARISLLINGKTDASDNEVAKFEAFFRLPWHVLIGEDNHAIQ